MSVVSIRQTSEQPAAPPESSVTGEEPAEAAGSLESAQTATSKARFPRPAETPTQEAPHGVRFDFNDGCRVLVPKGEEAWRVRLSDLDTGNILSETKMEAGRVNSAKRYFVRGRVEVWRGDESVFAHDYRAAGREVLINFPVGTLGDTLGWMPYAAHFRDVHGCRLTIAMAAPLIALFRDVYPDIAFVEAKDVDPERYYATYNLGLFFDDKACVHQPCDFRFVGLHRTAGYILGVDPKEEPPRIKIAERGRPIAEPCVRITTQSTTRANKNNGQTRTQQEVPTALDVREVTSNETAAAQWEMAS
jgi:autotransporter strand-loop-strand O-heptosyltransferase